MTMAFDRKLIDKYEQGPEHLAQAIRGLTREDLLAAPPEGKDIGKWTIQQVVIHLMDSELIAMDRMKRMIAMENPLLVGYDENLFIRHLMPEEQSAEDAVTILKLAFKNFAVVLRKLPDDAFNRPGTHNERGPVTMGSYLQGMIKHLEHHLKFIHAKRAAMGKEMW
jgi:DinB superfamily